MPHPKLPAEIVTPGDVARIVADLTTAWHESAHPPSQPDAAEFTGWLAVTYGELLRAIAEGRCPEPATCAAEVLKLEELV